MIAAPTPILKVFASFQRIASDCTTVTLVEGRISQDEQYVSCDVLLSICVLSVTSQPYNKREIGERQVVHLAFYDFLSVCDGTVMH